MNKLFEPNNNEMREKLPYDRYYTVLPIENELKRMKKISLEVFQIITTYYFCL